MENLDPLVMSAITPAMVAFAYVFVTPFSGFRLFLKAFAVAYLIQGAVIWAVVAHGAVGGWMLAMLGWTAFVLWMGYSGSR